MFNKKIIASALIGSLAFSLFPTNIFANNSLTENEKKVCEMEKRNIVLYDIDDNENIFSIESKLVDEDENYQSEIFTMYKNGKKLGESFKPSIDSGDDGTLIFNRTIHKGDFYAESINDEKGYIRNGIFENSNVGISFIKEKAEEDKIDKNGNISEYLSYYTSGDYMEDSKKLLLEKYNIELKENGLYRNGKLIKSVENGYKIEILNVFGEDTYFSTYKYIPAKDEYSSDSREKVKIFKNSQEIINLNDDHSIIGFLENKDIISTYLFTDGVYYKNGKKFFELKGSSGGIISGDSVYSIIYDDYYHFKIYKDGALIQNLDGNKLIKHFNKIFPNNGRNYYSINDIEDKRLFGVKHYFTLNGNIYSYVYLPNTKGDFGLGYLLKNGKALCENLDLNVDNFVPEKTKTENDNGNNNSGNTGNTNNGTSEIKGSAPNKKDLEVKNDSRVSSSNSTKTEETKKEEKISENKKFENNSLSENEKNNVKTLVSKIIKKYSYNKNILENLYKALNTREDIKKRAENNPRIKFVIEEYSRQYVNLK